MTPEIMEARNAICTDCDRNEDGVCQELKTILPERECVINIGVPMARAYCPLGKWGQEAHRRNCTQCERVIVSAEPTCLWCQRSQWREQRNRRRGLVRPSVPPPPVTFNHEEIAEATADAAKGARYRAKQPGGRRRGCFIQQDAAQWVSMSQLHHDTLALAAMIPPETDTIIGVARSGLAVATMVSMLLHRPLLVFQQTNRKLVGAGNGWRLGGSDHIEASQQTVAVIDDTCMTGNSQRATRSFISQKFRQAVYASVYVNPLARVKPDIWARDLGWPHLLEWNLFNSILTPWSCLDLDGILCHDCPPGSDDDGIRYLDFIRNARPKWLPRRTPVPLIVTARLEKYRRETEAWLARHGVLYHRLIMHPAATLRERRRDDIAAYKAAHFEAWAKTVRPVPGPVMFIESEDGQTKRIHEITGRLAVCPLSGRCYE